MSKYLTALAGIIFVLAKAVGVIPFSYNIKLRKASISTCWRCYSVGVLIAIIVLTQISTITLYVHMNTLKQMRFLAFIRYTRYLTLHLCAIFTVLTQLLKDRSGIYLCNEALHMFNQIVLLRRKDDKTGFFGSFSRKLVTKMITVLPITMMTCSYLVIKWKELTTIYVVSLLSVYCCQLVLIMTCNMFYGATLILAEFTHVLNCRLKEVLKDIRTLANQPCRANSLKMQKYCEFADILDRMMDLYRKVSSLRGKVNNQYQVQIVCFLLYVSIEIVVQCYVYYFVYTRTNDVDILLTVRGTVYTFSWLMELAVIITVAEGFEESMARTRQVLRIGAEIAGVDVRLERTVEHLALYLCDEKMGFTACGLFDVDNRSLFMIYRRLLISIAMLVQFDRLIKR